MACPPSGTRRRCRTGAPTGALALHPVRRLARHSGLEREPVGPAPIVRRSMPVSLSRASAATCAARVPAVSPDGSGPPTWPPSAPPSSRPSKTPATCTFPKARATIPPPPKPSASRPRLGQKRTFTEHAGALRQPPPARSGGWTWHPVDAAGWLASYRRASPGTPGLASRRRRPFGRRGAVAVAKVGRGRGGQSLGQGWRTILPGMPPAAFALNASAACASGYTAPTWGRKCPSSTRRASWIN